jgi:hypothetical protein
MAGMMFWMLWIAGSVAGLVLTAALKGPDPRMAFVHMAIAGGTAIVLALMGIQDARSEIDNGSGPARVAAAKARAMGLVWAWGALAMMATYATGVLGWKEWLHFTVLFIVASGLCMFFSATLKSDDSKGEGDDVMLRLARYFNIGQLAAMLITMVGLVVDGKMTRFMKEAGQRIGSQDWAASNYCFFGALALAALSAYALSSPSGKRNGKHDAKPA